MTMHTNTEGVVTVMFLSLDITECHCADLLKQAICVNQLSLNMIGL